MKTLSMRRTVIYLSAALLCFACSRGFSVPSLAQTNASHGSAQVATVTITNFKFEPETLTVNAGDTVEWKNVDIVDHTATSDDRKAFDSGSIAKNKSWRYKAKGKGTYKYTCTFHPNMTGTLIVK